LPSANGGTFTGAFAQVVAMQANDLFLITTYQNTANGQTRNITRQNAAAALTFPVAVFAASDQSANATPPVKGQIFVANTGDYLYVCTANGTIKRAALSTF
jgi:hypothetical protein